LRLHNEPVFIALVGSRVAQRVGYHRAPGVQVIDQFVVIDALVALGAGTAGVTRMSIKVNEGF
jgi:hypothetical protein